MPAEGERVRKKRRERREGREKKEGGGGGGERKKRGCGEKKQMNEWEEERETEEVVKLENYVIGRKRKSKGNMSGRVVGGQGQLRQLTLLDNHQCSLFLQSAFCNKVCLQHIRPGPPFRVEHIAHS